MNNVKTSKGVEFMKDMKRLFGYMGPYKKDMILGALFVMIGINSSNQSRS